MWNSANELVCERFSQKENETNEIRRKKIVAESTFAFKTFFLFGLIFFSSSYSVDVCICILLWSTFFLFFFTLSLSPEILPFIVELLLRRHQDAWWKFFAAMCRRVVILPLQLKMYFVWIKHDTAHAICRPRVQHNLFMYYPTTYFSFISLWSVAVAIRTWTAFEHMPHENQEKNEGWKKAEDEKGKLELLHSRWNVE